MNRPPASSVFDAVSPMIGDGGICPDSATAQAKIISALNLAQELLLNRMDARGSLVRWCRPVFGGCFALPWDCHAPRQAWLNGRSMNMRDEWWEGQLSVGIQPRCPTWFGSAVSAYEGASLIDSGEDYALPNPWPNHKNVKLAFSAESNGDAGKVVSVTYMDVYGHEQREDLVLPANAQTVRTAQGVSDVTYIHTPGRSGGLRVYQDFDWHDEHRRIQIAWIDPRVETPRWRRMNIPGGFSRGCNGVLLIKGKARFIPLRSGADPLFITNKMALRFGVQAIAAQERKNPDEYQSYVQNALNELDKELMDYAAQSATGQVQFASGLSFRPHSFR